MNKLFFIILVVTNISLASETIKQKIIYLEKNLTQLQEQINQLKAELGSSLSESNSQRIANLEAYAIQLHEVLTDVQEKVEDNTTQVERISKRQSNQPKLGVYGTITAGKGKNQDSVIDGNSFEIILSGQPHERISYFTELEFERAATVGGSRGGEVLLEQAYTDIKLNDWANFRGGILLMPFGNIERDHYSPLREVISKPYTAYALAPSDWTDNGFGLNGRFTLGESWFADYQAYIVAGLDDHISTTGLRATRQGFGVDNNNNKAFGGKISLHNTSGFTVGLSLYNGAWSDDGKKNITGYNIDADFQWRWLELIGEFTSMDIDRESTGTANMSGYYLRSIFGLNNLLPDNWLGEDFTNAKLSFITQYDKVVIENFFDASIADNSEQRLTLGLRFQPTSSWILNLNYEATHARGADRILRGEDDMWLFSLGYVF